MTNRSIGIGIDFTDGSPFAESPFRSRGYWISTQYVGVHRLSSYPQSLEKKSKLETWPRTLKFLNRGIFQCANLQIVKHRAFSIFDWREFSNFQTRESLESLDTGSRKSTNTRVCVFFSCSDRRVSGCLDRWTLKLPICRIFKRLNFRILIFSNTRMLTFAKLQRKLRSVV